MRTIVSQAFGIDGGKARFDYAGGGRQKWIDKIHAVKLGEITPARIQAWKCDLLAPGELSPQTANR